MSDSGSEGEFVLKEGPKELIRVWRKVMLEPREFYRHFPSHGGVENPLVFLGLCAAIYFGLKVIVIGLAGAINALFLVGLAYIFGPGILMLACQYLFEGEGDYEGTLRCCAYGGATLVLAWIPTVGIFGYLYSFYLIFLGTQRVHHLDPTKSAIATLSAILVTTAIVFFVLGEGRIRHPLL